MERRGAFCTFCVDAGVNETGNLRPETGETSAEIVRAEGDANRNRTSF